MWNTDIHDLKNQVDKLSKDVDKLHKRTEQGCLSIFCWIVIISLLANTIVMTIQNWDRVNDIIKRVTAIEQQLEKDAK